MKLLLLLSWKNIWRVRKRSFAVIGSITVGVWALCFLFAFLNSFSEAYVRNAILYDYSHLQVHHPEYRVDPVADHYLSQPAKLESALSELPAVQSFSMRTIATGMAATGRSSQGVQIVGVDPKREMAVTQLDKLLTEGEYFTGKRNPVLISEKVAKKLGANIRSKVVLTFQDSAGNITTAAFRVDGIFDSKSPRINEGVVYVRRADLQGLLQMKQIHETAILLHNTDDIPQAQSALTKEIPAEEILSFRELAPEFDLLTQQSSVSKQLLTSIIMLALLFGIVNTMLMAVLERTRELGMLRAVGMHKSKVFSMVMLETVLMAAIGGPAGVLLGAATNAYYNSNGLDLSSYAEMLKQYGYDAIFYPVLEPAQYPILMMVVITTALIGSIYPAIKAIKLNPVQSIRKI